MNKFSYLCLAIVRTCTQFMGPRPALVKLEGSLQLAGFTVNMAPMLCVLFIGARMRALQIDPLNGISIKVISPYLRETNKLN